MTRSEVLAVLADLCEGIDPISRQPIPSESVLQQPIVIRALFNAQTLLEQETVVDRKALPQRAGAKWSSREDGQLIQEFEGRLSIPMIARKHLRTRGAVCSRLVLLGKLVPDHRRATEDRNTDNSDAGRNRQRSQAGKSWTQKEDEMLLSYFNDGFALEDIAKELRRGVHGVEVRLYKLGRLSIESRSS